MVHFDVLVTSFGGVGSTWLMEGLKFRGVGVNPPHGVSVFKHGVPSGFVDCSFDRVVYCYDSPWLAVCSHFRRGWAATTHEFVCPVGLRSGREVFGSFEVFGREVLRVGRDLFGCKAHFDEWVGFSGCPVLFLDMGCFDQFVLSDFLGRDLRFDGFCRDSGKYDSWGDRVPGLREFYEGLHVECLGVVKSRNL